jgi:dTDP-4-dehydrorhamnose reductase
MRIVVTGRTGQVVTALGQRAGLAPDVTVVALGRPELDLADEASIAAALAASAPDVIVSAAAYTAVDQAETEPDLAERVNGAGAGAVAASARRLGVPVIHLSTDYVFDGSKASAYVESDPVGPVSAYGRSKLAGERAVAAANPDHVILRTAWVYAPAGKNFVRTMLRLAASRPELSVVADQHGCPSYAPDIADAVIAVARRLLAEPQDSSLRGVFHLCGTGSTDWAGFADAIFAESARRGGPSAKVRRIGTADYPTPARRPANSRLDCSKLGHAYGIAMPHWSDALSRCMDELAQQGALSAS